MSTFRTYRGRPELRRCAKDRKEGVAIELRNRVLNGYLPQEPILHQGHVEPLLCRAETPRLPQGPLDGAVVGQNRWNRLALGCARRRKRRIHPKPMNVHNGNVLASDGRFAHRAVGGCEPPQPHRACAWRRRQVAHAGRDGDVRLSDAQEIDGAAWRKSHLRLARQLVHRERDAAIGPIVEVGCV